MTRVFDAPRALVFDAHTKPELGGKTTLTQTVLYESRDARDAVLKSGMESGVTASYDRLADLLSTLA
jgi:uncharacterized protein YndB with AHSA1/START domain